MECGLDNSAKTVLPKNWNFSFISQNSRISGFSQKFFPEIFNWTRKMPSWRTWSFPSSQKFLRKTMKRYEEVPSFRKTFLKMFFWTRRVRFLHPCWKPLPKFRTISTQSQKRFSKLRFREKKQSSSSNGFSDHMECVFGKSATHVSPDKRSFFDQSPGGKKVLFSPEGCSPGEVKKFFWQTCSFLVQMEIFSRLPKNKNKSSSGTFSVWYLDA